MAGSMMLEKQMIPSLNARVWVDDRSYLMAQGQRRDMMEIKLGEDEAGISGQDEDQLDDGGPESPVKLSLV